MLTIQIANRVRPFTIHRRLAIMLSIDRDRRPPRPITLAGRPTVVIEPPPPPRKRRSETAWGPQLDCPRGEVRRLDAEPEDIHGPYTREQLLRMNARFVQRVKRAFKRGTETRAAATAQFRK